MTYKEIVDNIKGIVERHHILEDFGYGQISDIKTGGDDGEANYPYAFLNPQTHTRSERAINYRFNLIVMDMYLEDDFLSAQSQCQQYIDDILAEMKYGTQIYDIAINATLTPFKERFQDVVGGMTATIDIEVPQKLNLCIAPIAPDCFTELDVFSSSFNDFTYVRDPDDSSRSWRWETNTITDANIGTFEDHWFTNTVLGDFEFYVTQTITLVEPVGAEVLPQRPVLGNLFNYFGPIQPTCDSGNWPTVWSAESFVYEAKYKVTLDELTDFGIIGFENVAANESAVIQETGGTLTIGYSAPPTPPEPELTTIYKIEQSNQVSPFNRIGSGGGPSLDVNATIIDTQYLTESGSELETELLQDGTYRFTYTTTSSNLIDQSVIDAAKANNPTTWSDPDGKMYLQSGWFFGETLTLWNEYSLPFTTTIGDDYTVTHTLDIALPAGTYKFNFLGQPYSNELEYVAEWSNIQYQIELINLDTYIA